MQNCEDPTDFGGVPMDSARALRFGSSSLRQIPDLVGIDHYPAIGLMKSSFLLLVRDSPEWIIVTRLSDSGRNKCHDLYWCVAGRAPPTQCKTLQRRRQERWK